MRKPITAAILAALVGAAGVSGLPVSFVQAAAAASPADAEANMLFLARPFDTQRDTMRAAAPFTLRAPTGAALQLVQFNGPIQQRWLDQLTARGITPLQYIASNGYIVWTDGAGRSALDDLRNSAGWLQFSAPFYGYLKVEPRLAARIESGASNEEVDITVQMYRHAGAEETQAFIGARARLAPSQLGPVGDGKLNLQWHPVLAFQNIKLRVRLSDIAAIAERDDVVAVLPQNVFRLLDEKQNVILTGAIPPPTPAPAPNYISWLTARGFSTDHTQYPIVDVTDSPIHEGGTGPTVANTADQMLRVGGVGANTSRVAYFNNCSSSATNTVGAVDGHGALNGGIVAGYDVTATAPNRDADGYQLGMGVNPFGRVASTAIFVPGYSIAGCGNTDAGVIRSVYTNGARINTNSWGATIPPTVYDDSDQAYDIGTRDADLTLAGNQELIQIFAAANDGPGPSTVSSPGAGKNVITVGASENVRPGWTDGCNSGPTDADNAMDVVGFSSRGPAPGQRAKPEVIAPGTHIQARASLFSGYNGNGVCDQYYPPAQTLFAASSGTSHSTPAVAGVASLAWWWIERGGVGAAAGTIDEVGGSRVPSPALMKTWLIGHPTYLTGVDANDNLPSNDQGYGMPNLSLMFDATPKVLVDQDQTLGNTGEFYEITVGVADPTKPVRVAMAYTDAPGALNSTAPQVNNLDLRVVNGSSTYLGNVFTNQWSVTGGVADNKNNYEAVFLPVGTTGDLTIRVTGTAISGDGVPNSGDATDQDFAITCYNCSRQPSFTLSAATPDTRVCAGESFSTPIAIGQITGYNTPVNLSVSGAPTGATASVTPTTVTPPGTATFDLTNTASTPAGAYTTTLTGVSGAITKTYDLDITVDTVTPATPTLATPANGATNQPSNPTLTWNTVPQAESYTVIVSRNADFSTVFATTTTTQTSWTVTPELPGGQRFYWRVYASNACGTGGTTPPADRIYGNGFEAAVATGNVFTTTPQPGDCPVDSTQTVVFNDDMEASDNGWTHAGLAGTDSWTRGTGAPHGGARAWQANNFSAVNDQVLVSPAIAVPAGLSNLTLAFWNKQSIESSSTGCFDGAILERSTDNGATWTQVTSGLLTDPYNGAVSTQYSNPLQGLQAWCAEGSPYVKSVVDIQSLAGQSVKFRFRLANDSSVAEPNPGWAVDDVSVQGCTP